MRKALLSLAVVLLTLLSLPTPAAAQGGVIGNALGGSSETRNATELGKRVRQAKKIPITKWSTNDVRLVFVTKGADLIEVYRKEGNKLELKGTSKEGRQWRWSVIFSDVTGPIRAEDCNWKGDQAVGLFFIEVDDPQGGVVKQWACIKRPLDQEFLAVAKQAGWDISSLSPVPAPAAESAPASTETPKP